MDELIAVNSAERSWRVPRLPMVQLPQFDLHCHGSSADREAVETYIHNRFYRAHGASVSHYLPSLISLRCAGVYSAAVGLAPASNANLFVEHYLADTIEASIGALLKAPVERNKILEIGNLVSTWRGSSLLLFIFLSELIERLGFHWVVFTATREVERLLARMHYAPTVLADADPSVLPDGGATWGNYYTHQPRVMFGDVRAGVAMARGNAMYRSAVACIDTQIETIRHAFVKNNAGCVSVAAVNDGMNGSGRYE